MPRSTSQDKESSPSSSMDVTMSVLPSFESVDGLAYGHGPKGPHQTLNENSPTKLHCVGKHMRGFGEIELLDGPRVISPQSRSHSRLPKCRASFNEIFTIPTPGDRSSLPRLLNDCPWWELSQSE